MLQVEVSAEKMLFGILASYRQYGLKDLCFCLQLGDNQLSLVLPHSLEDGVGQPVVRINNVGKLLRRFSDNERVARHVTTRPNSLLSCSSD